MQEAIDRIVEASDMPLSIVIVGVGGADFKMMVKTHFPNLDYVLLICCLL